MRSSLLVLLLLVSGHLIAQQTFQLNTIQLREVVWEKPTAGELQNNTLVTSSKQLTIRVKANCNAPLQAADFSVMVNKQPFVPGQVSVKDNSYTATLALDDADEHTIYVVAKKGASSQQTTALLLKKPEVVAVAPPKPALAKRFALVMGNSNYQHSSSLNNRPLNDAQDVTQKLQALGFTVTTKTDADLRTMQRTLKDFSNQIAGADMALFFYAGHGIETGGVNYLLPVDAELRQPSDADVEAVSVQLFLDKLKFSGSTFSVMILDACRDNPFKNWNSNLRGGEDRGFSPITNLQGKGNMYLATATGWGNVAQNGQQRNGLYTEALLRHLQPGTLLEDVLNRAAIEVKRKTNGQQNPQLLTEPATDLKFNF